MNTSIHKKTNVMAKRQNICAVRESNPKLNLGRVSCYHYTNGAGDDDGCFLILYILVKEIIVIETALRGANDRW
jgi:hypothetical protein